MRQHAPDITLEEAAVYTAAVNRAALKRILTTEFGPDGKPKGVEPDLVKWATGVVQRRPEWAEPVLVELGIRPLSEVV